MKQQNAGETSRDSCKHPLRTPAFVGRDTELAGMKEALASSPCIVLVEGEAGSGKSRLVQEVLSSPEMASQRTLLGVCPPFRESLTLGPVVDAVRQACSDVAGLPLTGLAGALRPLFPEWAGDLPAAPEPLADAGAARHRLFRALAELIRTFRTTTVVMEDVHWADDATLEFLLFLMSRRQLTVNLLVTYRPEDVPAGSLLLRITSQSLLRTSRVRVTLTPLDVTATAGLVSSMLDGEPVSEEFAKFLHQRTDGLPLAVEESVRLLDNRADLYCRDGRWVRRSLSRMEVPPTVRDSVVERLHRLRSDARRLLRAAAVLAEPADETLLSEVSGLSIDQVRSGATDVLACGLLSADDKGRIGFRHVLMGDAAYDAIPPVERRRMHAAAGRVLQSVEPAPLAQLTRHFRAAGEIEEWCGYAEQAAEQAASSGHHTGAVDLLTDVLTDATLDTATRVRLAKKLGAAAAFRRESADDLQRRIIGLLRDVVHLPGLDPADQAAIRHALGRLLMQAGVFDEARVELESAVADLRNNPAQAARVMTYLGVPFVGPWPATTHLSWLRRAAEFTASVESAGERLGLITDRATALLLLGEAAGWSAVAQLPATSADVAVRHETARMYGNIGYLAIIWGRYADAERHLARGLELAAADRFQRIHSGIKTSQAHLDWVTGQWRGLSDRVAELEQGEGIDIKDRIEARLVGAMLNAVTDPLPEVVGRLETIRDETRTSAMLTIWFEASAALARLYLAEGHVAAALEVTDGPVQTIVSKQVWIWATDIMPARFEALIATGRLAEAAGLVTALGRGLRGRDAPAPLAALATCRALLADGQRDWVRAATAYQRAAKAWERLPRPYDAARARERQAGVMGAAGQVPEAVDVLAAVHHELAELGASADARRVARTLDVYGVRPRRAWRGGRRGYGDQLSPRELEVVRLVVAGHTNREIARKLSRSPHTIGKQLNAAMRKLGVTSRTALAVSVIAAGAEKGTPPVARDELDSGPFKNFGSSE